MNLRDGPIGRLGFWRKSAPSHRVACIDISSSKWEQALKLLRNGSSIKEIASQLGYKHHSSFTRKYKNQIGFCPSICKCCGLCLLADAHSNRKCPQMISNCRK